MTAAAEAINLQAFQEHKASAAEPVVPGKVGGGVGLRHCSLTWQEPGIGKSGEKKQSRPAKWILQWSKELGGL